MKPFYYPLLFFLLVITGSFKTVPKNDFVNDFAILEQTFRELHPALYNVIGKAEYDELVERTKERLSHITDREMALYLLQEYIFRLGDGHASTIDAFFEKDHERILPFKLAIADTQLYFLHYPAHPELEGTAIFSINGTAAHILIDSLRIFFTNDGARSIHNTGLSSLFNSLYAQFCGQPDTFLLSTGAGKFRVPAMHKEDSLYDWMVAYDWMDAVTDDYVLADSGSFGYVRFNNFLETSWRVKVEDQFNYFIDEMIMKNRKAIVVDLRYNDGGLPLMATRMAERFVDTSIAPVDRLFISHHDHPAYAPFLSNYPNYFFLSSGTRKYGDMLEKVRFEKTIRTCSSKKSVFRGKVYVLVSDVTASAATMFCSILRHSSNVVFVGSETGGAINYFWAHKLCQIRLPASGISVTFPLELIELKNGSSEHEQPIGLIPDVPIQYSISDYLSNEDLEMQYVLAHLPKN